MINNNSDNTDLSINNLKQQFLENPQNLEEWKVNILKKYYYSWCSTILELNNINEFKIGSNNKKNLLFFNSIKNPYVHLIINQDTNKYFILYKNFKKNNDLKIKITSSTSDEKNSLLKVTTNNSNTSKYLRCCNML